MRGMLDSSIWIALAEDEDLLDNFRRTYNSAELDVVFSIGNFLDLADGSDRDGVASVIDEFVDEYLAPLQLDLEGEYRYSSDPLILATVDAEWFEHCKRATSDLDERDTLRALFEDADFDDGPIPSGMARFVDEYREIETTDLEGKVGIPADTSREVAMKKIRTFPEYTERHDDGTMGLDVENIPKKRYVLGMSMIYVSETRTEPTEADYQDAMIWSQAIISGCDVLWTEQRWESDHPIIDRIVERLDRDDLRSVADLDEFETVVAA